MLTGHTELHAIGAEGKVVCMSPRALGEVASMSGAYVGQGLYTTDPFHGNCMHFQNEPPSYFIWQGKELKLGLFSLCAPQTGLLSLETFQSGL